MRLRQWNRPAILHPLALGAVVLLLLNDQWGKSAFPGALTGKLSDFAGLAFFPLFLQALVELPRWLRDDYVPSRRVLLGCIAATGLVFAAVNLWGPAAGAYEVGLGGLQWFLQGAHGSPHRVALTRDPTDLIALSSLGVAWWLGRRTRLSD